MYTWYEPAKMKSLIRFILPSELEWPLVTPTYTIFVLGHWSQGYSHGQYRPWHPSKLYMSLVAILLSYVWSMWKEVGFNNQLNNSPLLILSVRMPIAERATFLFRSLVGKPKIVTLYVGSGGLFYFSGRGPWTIWVWCIWYNSRHELGSGDGRGVWE